VGRGRREVTFVLEYECGSKHPSRLTGYGQLAKILADADQACSLLLFCSLARGKSSPPAAR
jgi:hypothetical protein